MAHTRGVPADRWPVGQQQREPCQPATDGGAKSAQMRSRFLQRQCHSLRPCTGATATQGGPEPVGPHCAQVVDNLPIAGLASLDPRGTRGVDMYGPYFARRERRPRAVARTLRRRDPIEEPYNIARRVTRGPSHAWRVVVGLGSRRWRRRGPGIMRQPSRRHDGGGGRPVIVRGRRLEDREGLHEVRVRRVLVGRGEVGVRVRGLTDEGAEDGCCRRCGGAGRSGGRGDPGCGGWSCRSRGGASRSRRRGESECRGRRRRGGCSVRQGGGVVVVVGDGGRGRRGTSAAPTRKRLECQGSRLVRL